MVEVITEKIKNSYLHKIKVIGNEEEMVEVITEKIKNSYLHKIKVIGDEEEMVKVFTVSHIQLCVSLGC